MTQHAPFTPITDFDSNFQLMTPKQLIAQVHRHDVGGVYTIALRGIHHRLRTIGYREEPSMPEAWSGQYFHVYTGETYSLKSRMKDHLYGQSGGNFRKSLSAVTGLHDAELTVFLFSNGLIGYRYFPYMGDVERYLIEHTACPLNLRGKANSAFATRLRAQLRERKETA